MTRPASTPTTLSAAPCLRGLTWPCSYKTFQPRVNDFERHGDFLESGDCAASKSAPRLLVHIAVVLVTRRAITHKQQPLAPAQPLLPPVTLHAANASTAKSIK